VRRARELVPVLKARARKQWQHPKIFDETVADLQDAGFFQMLQPRRWSGGETTPIESFEVATILSEADASVGWVVGVVGIHSYHLAFFDERAQEEVWGSNPKTLISSPYAPGKAVRVDGGFILNGRWSFSSGGDHCAWTFLGANVEGEENTATARMSGLPTYTFLLPRADYQIVPNWDVHGLRATGSNDVIVKDAFVPEHRTLKWEQVLTNTAPGLRRNDGLLYRLPFFQIFSRATQAPSALGALKGMVQAFIDFNANKVSRHGQHIGQNPAATLAPRNIVSLARMKKLAPISAHCPASSALAQKMPAVLPRAKVAAMMARIASDRAAAPSGPIAPIDTDRSPGPTKTTSTPSTATISAMLASPSAVSTCTATTVLAFATAR